MKKILFALLLLSPVVYGAPTIPSITGTIQNGQSIVITCTGAGSKSPAGPLVWAPFDNNANPSGLGQVSSFGKVENMAWDADEGYNGGGGVKGTAGAGVYTMYVNTPGTAYNAFNTVTYRFYRERLNFLVTSPTQNWKSFRFWPNSGNVSNLYSSIHNGRVFVENIGGSTDSGYWSNTNQSTTNWLVKEIFVTANSANSVKDGSLSERFGGVQKHSGSLITRSAAAPNDWTKFVAIHGVLANQGTWSPAWSSSNNLWADDLYVDRTFQRVMIGDASTLANSRKLGICVPTSWAATSITCQLSIPLNDFPAQTTAYAYVVDTTNTPNTAGKAIVIGGSVAGNPVPTIFRVSPSTKAFSGSTVSTVTGTGFLAGATVLVGTNSATGVGLSGSTSIYFTIPPNVAGTRGYDLTVTNTDGQFAVLQSTMGYEAGAVNQAPYNVSAGDDWEITLPDDTLISGIAEDDGLPSGTLTYLWQRKTGGGIVTFADATALQTTAIFSSSGTYTISLTASDSLLSTESAEVTVIVHPVIGTTGGTPGGTAYRFSKQ